MLEELKNQGWEIVSKEEYDKADTNYEHKTIIALANPELFDILEHTRKCGIVPNITINGSMMTDDLCERLVRVLGAIAVSRYDKDICYNTILSLNNWKEKLGNEATLKQVNIHQILSENSLDDCWELLHDIQEDQRLKDLNAVVFLTLKPKGKRNTSTPLKSLNKFKKLIDYALDNKLPIGFDSCGCGNFLKAVKDRKDYTQLEMLAEPCESTCFSMYIDVNGSVWPCSFCEDHPDIEPLNILDCENFIDDVWNGKQYSNFRTKLLKNTCRSCPIFDLNME